MYKNGIWKPQEPYDYFPQAQKVYIETVVKKKKQPNQMHSRSKTLCNEAGCIFQIHKLFFFNPPDKYHMKD